MRWAELVLPRRRERAAHGDARARDVHRREHRRRADRPQRRHHTHLPTRVLRRRQVRRRAEGRLQNRFVLRRRQRVPLPAWRRWRGRRADQPQLLSAVPTWLMVPRWLDVAGCVRGRDVRRIGGAHAQGRKATHARSARQSPGRAARAHRRPRQVRQSACRVWLAPSSRRRARQSASSARRAVTARRARRASRCARRASSALRKARPTAQRVSRVLPATRARLEVPPCRPPAALAAMRLKPACRNVVRAHLARSSRAKRPEGACRVSPARSAPRRPPWLSAALPAPSPPPPT